MTSRPPSAGSTATSATTATTATGTTASRSHPTPHHTAARSRNVSSSTRVPPQAPKPSRRPATDSSGPQTNPIFSLARVPSIPQASYAKPDDILAPPDAQSCPFTKAGLKMLGIGNGPYGELDGWLEWPAELYANERKEAQTKREIKSIYNQHERMRSRETTIRVIESLRSKVEKLKEDEWMYSATDTLFSREK